MITGGMAERAAGQRGSILRNRLARASCAVRPRVHHKRGDTLTRSAVARRCHGVLNQFDDRLAGGRACDAKVRAPHSRKRCGRASVPFEKTPEAAANGRAGGPGPRHTQCGKGQSSAVCPNRSVGKGARLIMAAANNPHIAVISGRAPSAAIPEDTG